MAEQIKIACSLNLGGSDEVITSACWTHHCVALCMLQKGAKPVLLVV